MTIRSTGEELQPEAQRLVDIDHAFVDRLTLAINDYVDSPPFELREHPMVGLLRTRTAARTIVNVTEMYLRNADSIAIHDVEKGVDTLTLFNAMERSRTALTTTMVGVSFEDHDPSLADLYAKFSYVYLPGLVHRISSVAFAKPLYEDRTREDVAEAMSIFTYMGRAVIVPVVRASSAMFEEALKANLGDTGKNLRYFGSNILPANHDLRLGR